MPVYLESSNIRNNALYERYGFEITGDYEFPEGDLLSGLYVVLQELKEHILLADACHPPIMSCGNSGAPPRA
jgi:hypothetical protein